MNRESTRIKDAGKKRILDEAARNRRLKKALEALEIDNYHDDPHADLVMSKKVPKFSDSFETRGGRKKKGKGLDYYKQRYRKSFPQLVEEDKHNQPDPPNYTSAEAPPSAFPQRHFCAVCGYFSNYTCVCCGTRFCSVRCLGVHMDTRCQKWTAIILDFKKCSKLFKMSHNTFNRAEIISGIIKLSALSVGTFFLAKLLFSHLDPTKTQKKRAKKKAQEQLSKIGIDGVTDLSDYELVIASHLVNPSDIPVSWTSIAGLKDTIQELRETVILPVHRKDLFAESQLTQAPKGVLLHGPPGCGKTMIAKATAREANMRFINLDVSILTDKWYGESQKLASAVFSLAVKLQPCIIFIDEIDSFLRNRNTQDHEATAMMKAQFMSLWDGLITDPNCTVIIMGATNRPSDLDKAILRRMPAQFYINLPDEYQRKEILDLILKNEPIDSDINTAELAKSTSGFSGSDLREMCRNASVYRIRDYIRNSSRHISADSDSEEYSDTLRPISKRDLETALHKMKISKVHSNSALDSVI